MWIHFACSRWQELAADKLSKRDVQEQKDLLHLGEEEEEEEEEDTFYPEQGYLRPP